MKKLIPVILCGTLLFSCSKEPSVSLTPDRVPVKTLSLTTLLEEAEINTYLDQLQLGDYTPEGEGTFQMASGAHEVIKTYTNSSGGSMFVTLADFGNMTEESKNHFLSGVSFPLATDNETKSFSLESYPTAGYAIQQYTDEGAISMTSYRTADAAGLGIFCEDVATTTGSFINASLIDANVPGWHIYDATSGVGYVILLVNDRFGIVVSGSDLDSMSALIQTASTFDFDGLTDLGN